MHYPAARQKADWLVGWLVGFKKSAGLFDLLAHFNTTFAVLLGLKILSGISIEGSTRMMLEGGGKKSK